MILVLFGVLAIALILGVPVGFAISLSALIALAVDGSTSLVIIAQRITNGGMSFTLLALPLFIFAGNLMAYGCTPRLMNFANMLLGRKKGGIATAGSVACAFFGAVSGSGVATTAAIGSIVAPEMVKQNYGKGYTASLIAASGTLGCLIPPSISAVVYAGVAGTSVGKQLFAGVGPGILTMLCLIGCNYLICHRKGYGDTGTVPHKYTPREKLHITIQAIPPFIMPIIILGGIMSGIVTPTESAAIAVVYALILALFVYRELTLKELYQCMGRSIVASAVITLIMSAAAPFAWILTVENVAQTLSAWVFAISQSKIFIYAAISIIILILGTFMEATSIIIIMTPILLPIVQALGMDPIVFGTLIIAGTDIGAVTPPLAVCLYTACDIVKIKIQDVFPDIWYVLAAMCIGMIGVLLFPQLSLWLPSVLIK